MHLSLYIYIYIDTYIYIYREREIHIYIYIYTMWPLGHLLLPPQHLDAVRQEDGVLNLRETEHMYSHDYNHAINILS